MQYRAASRLDLEDARLREKVAVGLLPEGKRAVRTTRVLRKGSAYDRKYVFIQDHSRLHSRTTVEAHNKMYGRNRTNLKRKVT